MPNIQQLLKEEIARVSRKEIKTQMGKTLKQVAEHKKEISTLRKQVAELQRKVTLLSKQEKRVREAQVTAVADGEAAVKPVSGKRIATHRKKLGLSASDFAKLVGASMQSVYFWEQERTKPRATQLVKLHEVLQIGVREANRRLEEIQ